MADAGRLLADTDKAQTLASDPRASAWVGANAGAGKTHVLKRRVLRLLLAGTAPDRILCLTYTKAAAAEMASRVFADLSQWSVAKPAELAKLLTEVLGRAPDSSEMDRARTMFARAIETPGGLKVQTIHAFCERLLQRFPLEAGVPPAFSILDDDESRQLVRSATDKMLVKATSGARKDLNSALSVAIAYAAGDGFDEALTSALARRDWLSNAVRLALIEGKPFELVEKRYRKGFGIEPGMTAARLSELMAQVLSDAEIRMAIQALAEGTKNDQTLSQALGAVAKTGSVAARVATLKLALFTAQGEPRSDRFVTKGVQQAHPGMYERLRTARDRLFALEQQRLGLSVVEATVALMRLASEVTGELVAAKAVRAALDFDDLIQRSVNLLATSGAAAWVLYKLDGGIDHVLVDEAQDTSPLQWQLIRNLTEEFFAGSGARADELRTVFAVGDKKQSIYSFQGAAPHMFHEAGRKFEEAARSIAAQWHHVPLQLSFRTVDTVLVAVDRVFADLTRTPGVATAEETVRHFAKRQGHAGLVEVWPTEKAEDVAPAEPWAPLADKGTGSPVARLASRIAETIAGWIARGDRLPSEDRPIRAGDVLILVRRRRPFASAMVRALKARGIPVAGADRLELKDQIAVQDILALCEFVSLPEDDLALACVLKGPLFGLDDDDLIRLAPQRKGLLWSALLEAAKGDARLAAAAETLKRWRRQADLDPPFEFLAGILDRDGGRRKFIARLGPDAIEPISELLNLALQYDDSAPASLVGFVDWLRSGRREVRRDMDQGRDEVRVMTVHGAKGLEAPIVFLPDTCSSDSGGRPGKLVALGEEIAWPKEAADPPYAWQFKGASQVATVQAAIVRAKHSEAEERNRLLYVAMTRARDRLYVAGFEGRRARARDCWYEAIVAGLEGLAQKVEINGGAGLRLETPQTAAPETTKGRAAEAIAAQPAPAWAMRPAPREERLAIPLAPSRLAPLDIDETGDPVAAKDVSGGGAAGGEKRVGAGAGAGAGAGEARSPSPLRMAGEYRFLRGTITHALLEHLPGLDAAGWERAATGFVERRGAGLPARVRRGIVDETLAVMRDPAFAAVFSSDSRAEVPIVAEIAPPGGAGSQPLRITGQLDRIVVSGKEVLIVDYKTNRPPPREAIGVAQAYLLQLAAYRAAIALIYPGKAVRAAILWTDGPRLMEIPRAMLDTAERELWQHPSRRAQG